MIMKFVCLFVLLIVVGCQNSPTKVLEENVNVFGNNTVLVDTRSAFNFVSFHVPGSVNLNTSDYLILKNPKTSLRILDPDIQQTIERLAKRGINPNKRVILLSDSTESVESKKWRWLLRNIEVESVNLMTIAEFKKEYKARPFAEPKSESSWTLNTSEDLQKEFIIKKSKDCFVNWSDKICK